MLDRPLEQLLESRGAAISSESATEFIAYRTTLSRRIAKLRKDLSLQAKTSKGSNKLKVKSELNADQIQEDPRYASLSILLMEREWTNAMETKSTLETNGSSIKRRHVISKLSKGLKYSKSLESVVSSSESDGPYTSLWKLQTGILILLLEAALYFEQKHWSKATLAYSKARVGLEAVISVAATENHKQLLRDLLNATVDPSLGFAAYQADPRKKRSTDLLTYAKSTVLSRSSKETAAFVILVKQISEKDVTISSDTKDPSTELGPIVWREHTAVVKNPDLATAIIEARRQDASVDDLLSDSSRKDVVGRFDPVLQAWLNALDILSDRLEKLEEGENQFDEDTQTLYIISTYIKYSLIFRRIQRDTLIIKRLQDNANTTTSKSGKTKLNILRDVFRLYDSIIQSSTELLELPGVFNDDQLASTLETVRNYFKAQKICTLAQAYQISEKRLEVLALYDLASKTLTKSDSITVEVHGKVVTQSAIDTTVNEIHKKLEKCHALAHIETTYRDASKTISQQAIADHLDIYPYGEAKSVAQRIADIKPDRLLPAPVKPVFYDIAFNYINYDEFEKSNVLKKAGNTAAATEETKKGGLLSGIWGRK